MFWNLCIMTGECLTEEAGDKIDAHLPSVLGCLYTRVATSAATPYLFNIHDIHLSHRINKV